MATPPLPLDDAAPAVPLQRRRSLGDVLDRQDSSRSPTLSWKGLKAKAMESVVGGSTNDAASWKLADLPASFFDLPCKDAKGADLPLSQLRGQVVLACNVASA